MWSRRALLRSIAGTALTAGIARHAWAYSDDETLPFRKNAPLLQLNFNENAAGMSPNAIAAAEKFIRDRHNRYPDDEIAKLRELLASQHDVSPDQILAGSGSTEILQLTVKAAAQQGATVIDAAPTYGQVIGDAKLHGLQVKVIPVRSDFTTDIDAMRAAANATEGPVLINLCNPNNPTGTIIGANSLTDWITDAPDNHFFLIDEAYFDYASAETPGYESMLPLVKAGRENLLIARTFSKVHGMAGLRVGYGIATPATIGRIGAFSSGINLNGAGAAAAATSLTDTDFYKASLSSNQTAKKQLLDTLTELELEHIPSSTNFVLHRIRSNVADYQRRMKANRILVGRRMTKEDGWNRLSLGTPEQMTHFTRTLREFRKRGWV